MIKTLEAQIAEQEKKQASAIEDIRKAESKHVRIYNKLKKLYEKKDSVISEHILTKKDLRLTQEQWDFVLQGDGTDAMYKAQEHVIQNLLGLYRGGQWGLNGQLAITITQSVDMKVARNGIAMLAKRYRVMKSLIKNDDTPVIVFNIRDKHLSARGSYYLEVLPTGDQARIVEQYIGRGKVYRVWDSLRLQLEYVKKNLQKEEGCCD